MIAWLATAAGRIVAIVGAFVGLALLTLWYRSEMLDARATVATQQAALAANAAALADVRERAAQNEAALTASATAARERAERLSKIRQVIYAAPNSNACMASAPVRAAIDGLRANRDANADGAAHNPGRAIDVQPSAGASQRQRD